MTAPAIDVDKVQKRYGENVVLHETSLTIARGESLAILGASGSGKSTLLKIVMGLTEPDSGRVTILGDVMKDGARLELRRKMGYVIQEGGLFPHLTARRNVSIMAEHLRWEEKKTRERVDELRELVLLPNDALDRYPRELSGGQRQRVGIMRALLLDPPILLLDEPLGALDAISRGRLQKDLLGIFERLHKAVLLVTHDILEAKVLAAEIVVLDGGRIAQRGTLADLAAKPSTPFVAELLATLPGGAS